MIAALLSLAVLGAGAEPGPLRVLGPAPRGEVRRVVTLAPSLTDLVLALGAGERLVGVSRFDERPEVGRLPRVGGFVDPSVEAVLALHPDLVLAQPGPGNRRAVETLAELGAPVLLLPLGTVADVLAAERATGKALGLPGQGEALARALEATRERVRGRARAERRVRVLLVYGFEPLVVAGPGGFADELLADAGAVNVAADAASPYPVYSVERAIQARPELILDASDTEAGKERVRALPGLREARWADIEGQALLHPGPTLGKGLEQLFRLVHPGAPQ
ncbi:MAG TPA: helical backbone metal receptor [Myxococcaceae bacterium]|nr:helical backbone metal receptor [Myxococcaceae bacterium]